MLARSAFRRSRTTMEMASSPNDGGMPSEYTRCSDSANGSCDSIQNRHQPADSQPRKWATTGSGSLDWVSGGPAQTVIVADMKAINAPAMKSRFEDALGIWSMHGVKSDRSHAKIGIGKNISVPGSHTTVLMDHLQGSSRDWETRDSQCGPYCPSLFIHCNRT